MTRKRISSYPLFLLIHKSILYYPIDLLRINLLTINQFKFLHLSARQTAPASFYTGGERSVRAEAVTSSQNGATHIMTIFSFNIYQILKLLFQINLPTIWKMALINS